MVHFAGGTGAALFSSALFSVTNSLDLPCHLVLLRQLGFVFWIILVGQVRVLTLCLFMFVFADPFHEVKRKRDKKKEVVYLSNMPLPHF
jgi:hypothetical protein